MQSYTSLADRNQSVMHEQNFKQTDLKYMLTSHVDTDQMSVLNRFRYFLLQDCMYTCPLEEEVSDTDTNSACPQSKCESCACEATVTITDRQPPWRKLSVGLGINTDQVSIVHESAPMHITLACTVWVYRYWAKVRQTPFLWPTVCLTWVTEWMSYMDVRRFMSRCRQFVWNEDGSCRETNGVPSRESRYSKSIWETVRITPCCRSAAHKTATSMEPKTVYSRWARRGHCRRRASNTTASR